MYEIKLILKITESIEKYHIYYSKEKKNLFVSEIAMRWPKKKFPC